MPLLKFFIMFIIKATDKENPSGLTCFFCWVALPSFINTAKYMVLKYIIQVVKLLQFSAQASHELVPPDAVEPVLK